MPLTNREKRALIGELNKLAAELGTMEDIRAIGVLNDRMTTNGRSQHDAMQNFSFL